MSIPSLVRPPAAPAPQRRPGRAPLFPYLAGGLAVCWLATVVLPAEVPDQSGSAYLGAGILAVAGGVAGVVAAARLRARYATDRRALMVATPVLAMAIVSMVLAGLAYVTQGPSEVLSHGLDWTAELGALFTLIALLPMAGSDGARMVHAFIARRRGEAAAAAADATVSLRAGVLVLGLGVALAVTVDIGLGLAAMLLGWFSLGSGRIGRTRQRLATSLANSTAGDVVTTTTPLPSWRTLSDALGEQPWPANVTAVPVAGWSGEPAGVLLTAVADRAISSGNADVRVERLAVPAALVPVVDADAPAADLLAAIGGTISGAAVVVKDGNLVGVVTAADLAAAAAPTRLSSRQGARQRMTIDR